MVQDPPTRPFRAAERTRLLDGEILGIPPADEGNPILEERGFERLVSFAQEDLPFENVYPNATLDGSVAASDAGALFPQPTPARYLPRAIVAILKSLLEDTRNREPQDGDSAFFAAKREENVAVAAEAVLLDVQLEQDEELFIASVGTDALDGQDQVEVLVDGDVVHRALFSPMTISEARGGRCFEPPLRATRSVSVKITNNGAAPASFTANLRGWRRDTTVLSHEDELPDEAGG